MNSTAQKFEQSEINKILGRERKTVVYDKEYIVTDIATGEILSRSTDKLVKSSVEPDFIKVYYQTMLAFNEIHDIPVSFVLSLSKFVEWSNDGAPLVVTLNKRNKEIMQKDCSVSLPQLARYITRSVNNGLLFRTKYRGVFEVNPFMIAKGKWDSIKQLRTSFDFIGGKWQRMIESEEDKE